MQRIGERRVRDRNNDENNIGCVKEENSHGRINERERERETISLNCFERDLRVERGEREREECVSLTRRRIIDW